MTAYQNESRDDDGSRGIDALRQETIDRLTEAFAADAIGMDEYERRATSANAASRRAELEILTVDLPAAKGAPRESAARQGPRRGADRSIVGAAPITTGCVMSERTMTGNWLSSDRVSSFTVMGSTRLDLRDSVLPPGAIKIEAFTLMGETQVIVPRDVPVRMNAFAFMGESRAGREVNQRVGDARTWVEISGFAMMGSVVVRAKD